MNEKMRDVDQKIEGMKKAQDESLQSRQKVSAQLAELVQLWQPRQQPEPELGPELGPEPEPEQSCMSGPSFSPASPGLAAQIVLERP